jgi:hypothetical protein
LTCEAEEVVLQATETIVALQKELQEAQWQLQQAQGTKAKADTAELHSWIGKRTVPMTDNSVAMGQTHTANFKPTTMMIRNIPGRLQMPNLKQAIDSKGFAGTYQFVHIPSRSCQTSNLGYAFVDFYDPKVAASFAVAFEGYQFSRTRSTKKCTVTAAEHQKFNPISQVRHRINKVNKAK